MLAEQEKELSLGSEAIGNLKVGKKQWGFYQIFESSATHKSQTIKKFALTGNLLDQKNSFALFLNNSEYPLAIAGNCKIIGNCYMPKLGYKKDKLNGVYFNGDNLVEGQTFENTNCPFTIDDVQKSTLSDFLLSSNFKSSDSIINLEESLLEDTVRNSFYTKTLVYYSTSKINLVNSFFGGNVVIVSKNEIEVSNNASLKDVILMAPIIRIKNGARIIVQAFASDSIILEDDVSLNYPSALGLFCKGASNNPSCIKLSENDTVVGTVIGFISNSTILNEVGIIIPSNAVVIGEVYTNGYLDLQGKVLGTVITNKFLINSSSSVHENFFYNGIINSKNIPAHFVGSSILKRKSKMGIIKWLN